MPQQGQQDPTVQYETFRQFGGMDRKSLRTSIARTSFSYLQNLMPVGNGNLQTVRGTLVSATYSASNITAVRGWSVNLLSLLTVTGVTGTFLSGDGVFGELSDSTGTVIAYNVTTGTMQIGNVTGSFAAMETLNNTSRTGTATVVSQATNDWTLISMSDGSLWAENTAVSVSGNSNFYQIAPAGTYINDVSPWSDTVALLVGFAGYYSWNGSLNNISLINTFQSTVLTFTPMGLITLSSSTGTFMVGETVTGTTSHETATVVYYDTVDNYLYFSGLSGTGFTVGETVSGASSSATGVVNTFIPAITPSSGTVYQLIPGSTAPSSANGFVQSYNPTTQQIQLTTVTGVFTVGGLIFAGSKTQPIGQILIADASAPPERGNAIAVYQGRVWVATGRTVSFNEANDYTAKSWDAALGAGSFTISDSTLIGDITRLIVANGYLYIFGPTSIDIVSGVYVPTGASPPTPTFTRTNINATVGSPYPQSIIIYERLILLYNSFGIFALSGIQVEKISDPIDTILQQINYSGPGTISAAVGTCNNLLVASFLINWKDSVLNNGLSRQTILTFFQGKWFFYDPFGLAPQGTLQCLLSSFVSDRPVAQLLYTQLASSTIPYPQSSVCQNYLAADAPLQRYAQTPLWDLGLSVMTKQALRFGIEGDVINLNFYIDGQVDSETQTSQVVSFLPTQFNWTNSLSQPVTWYNNSNQVVAWVVPGYVYGYNDVTNYGKYLGITLSGTCGDAIISGFNLEYRRNVRGVWAL